MPAPDHRPRHVSPTAVAKVVPHGRHRARRGPGSLIAKVLLLALFAGAVGAYASMQKTVVLTVDGVSHRVHTFARTVGQVLATSNVVIGVHDLVAPGASVGVSDGTHVVVQHGRPLTLMLDGHQRTVWVTASTVSEALSQLGLAQRGMYVSASRSRALPMEGMSLTVRRPHGITILHDGRSTHVRTSVGSVLQALAVAHIRLGPHDRISVSLHSMPRDGEQIRVTRVRMPIVWVTSSVRYRTIRHADSDLYKGETRVVRAGRVGIRAERYKLTIVDGHVRHRQLLSKHMRRHPRPAIVYYGTKARPTYGSHVPGADNLNWYALAGCESGHNPREYTSPGYYGLYQFTLGTWESLGGTGDPRDASVNEQTYRAKLLYVRAGSSPWPACGHYLYS